MSYLSKPPVWTNVMDFVWSNLKFLDLLPKWYASGKGEKRQRERERGEVITFLLTHYSSVLFNLASSYNLQLCDRFIERIATRIHFKMGKETIFRSHGFYKFLPHRNINRFIFFDKYWFSYSVARSVCCIMLANIFEFSTFGSRDT